MRRSLGVWVLAVVLAVGCSRAADAPRLSVVRSWELPDGLNAVDFARDGQALLLGAAQGESSLWNAPWNLSVTFDRVPGTLLAASFTGDGQVVLARDNGGVELRSSSGAVIQELRFPLTQKSLRASVSPTGRFVAFDGRVFDLVSTKLIAEAAPATRQTALEFAGDQFALVTSFDDAAVTALGLNGSHPRRLQASDDVASGAISSDGRFVAAGTTRGVVLWDGDRSDPSCELRAPGEVRALQFSGSGSWLAIASGRKLIVIDVKACRRRVEVQLDHEAVALDVDDDLVAVGDARGGVYVWDAFNERLIARGSDLAGAVTQLRLHAATRRVLAGTAAAGKAQVVLLRVGGSG